MSVARLLSRWKSEPSIANSVEVWRELPAKPSQFAPFPAALHPALVAALAERGIRQLYTHQAQSLEAAAAGQDLVIVTGAASGKSLCYQLPLLDCLLRSAAPRALLIFPTKALAQDQTAALRALIGALPAAAQPPEAPLALGIYDGDTPLSQRQPLRQSARLLVTNPDMLHLGILPHHARWAEFFANLRYVVLDEAHIYRGVFGSHVGNVLRRLRRIAAFYGAQPQFILTSATISNPLELAERLIERAPRLIDQDGAGSAPKTFLFYNPPVIDPSLGLRRSALQETVRLAADLYDYDVQTIVFGRSRRTVELLLTFLRQQAAAQPPASAPAPDPASIRGYRSGYRPEQRREIERGLRQGQVRTVIATNALELGIDIGGMGAVLLVGYPGTIAAAWQQAGRAGRRTGGSGERSLAALIATADPLDQFLAAHPEYFFDRSPERALINPDNPLILLDHLRCAAFELPFKAGERFGRLDPDELRGYLDFLTEQGALHPSGERYFWMADQYPAQAVSLRSAAAQAVTLQTFEDEQPATLGQVDQASAVWMAHPKAVYLHEAETYLVEALDLENHTARLRPERVDYYTTPRRETSIGLLELHAEQPVRGARKFEGELSVTTRVTGFKRLRWLTRELIDQEALDLPPATLLTTGYWVSLTPETVDQLKESGLWNNYPNDYGANWEIQRQRALARDNHTCQVCGAPERERSHHVHHRAPFRTFASFLEANQLENLVTLCAECHRRVETVVRVRSGLAGLAYALGNLAPFFLMCDASDLGVHSDPQSPLAQGAPTVALYDQIPAGLGFSRQLYELHAELIQGALELVSACGCELGCPSCVGPGGELGAGSKPETLAILKML